MKYRYQIVSALLILLLVNNIRLSAQLPAECNYKRSELDAWALTNDQVALKKAFAAENDECLVDYVDQLSASFFYNPNGPIMLNNVCAASSSYVRETVDFDIYQLLQDDPERFLELTFSSKPLPAIKAVVLNNTTLALENEKLPSGTLQESLKAKCLTINCKAHVNQIFESQSQQAAK